MNTTDVVVTGRWNGEPIWRPKTAQERLQDILQECIGCGGRATRTNNTLCIDCWHDAEGNHYEE